MINEIQKRPFVRLLFIWIFGILLQAFIQLSVISFILLLFPLFALSFSFISGGGSNQLMYEMRWLWGLLFSCLLLFLSIQITAAYDSDLTLISTNLFQEKLEIVRQNLLESFDHLRLTDNEKSVLATITLGYRKAMPYDLRQQFATIGMAHLLAVSGFHIGVIGMIVSRVLSVLPNHVVSRWMKYVLVLLMVWIYTCITGLAASAVRAAIMLSIYFTGKQLKRGVDSYNTLAASAFLMLVYNPWYLFDIGFQLSYLAVFSILYFQPYFSNLIKVRNPILLTPWEWITITLAAQLGVTMLCLYYFGQFSAIFLFANLPLTLIATILIPVSVLWMIVSLLGYDMEWLRWCVESLTRSMMKLVDMFSQIPGSTIAFHFDLFSLLLGYLSLILVMWYWKSKTPKLLLLSLLLFLLILIRLYINKI